MLRWKHRTQTLVGPQEQYGCQNVNANVMLTKPKNEVISY